MARKKAKVVAKKAKSKVGRPRRNAAELAADAWTGDERLLNAKAARRAKGLPYEKPAKKARVKRRTAAAIAKEMRKEGKAAAAKPKAAATTQMDTLCDLVSSLGFAVKEMHVDVRPLFAACGDLKKHVDDLRYRLALLEERVNKGAGTSLVEFPVHELARVLANRLETEEAPVAQ